MNLAATLDFSPRGVTRIVADALNRHFANSKSAAKEIADKTGCGVRTAEHWLAGRHAPDVFYFLQLLKEVPGLQAEVRRIIGMEANLDPEFQQAVHALIQVYHRTTAVDQLAARHVAAAATQATRRAASAQSGAVAGAGDDVEQAE